MDQFEHYITAFGPLAILLGAALEGQTAVIAGGVLAHKGLIPWPVAFGAAAFGSWVVDHLLFVLGRSFRMSRFVRRMAAKRAFGRAMALIERYPVIFILSFRFLFGLRAVGPVAVGVCDVSTMKFTLLNIAGALLWAGVFTGLGYAFGPAVVSALEALAPHALPIAVASAGVVVVALVLWRWRVWVTQERTAP